MGGNPHSWRAEFAIAGGGTATFATISYNGSPYCKSLATAQAVTLTRTTGGTYTTAPTATINYAGSPYCATTGSATVTLTGVTGAHLVQQPVW